MARHTGTSPHGARCAPSSLASLLRMRDALLDPGDMTRTPASMTERAAALGAEVHRLEALAWQEEGTRGVVEYVVICGAQRWGAPLFAINVLCAHAFAWAPPDAMDFGSTVAGFIGFHLAGAAIALTIWARNRRRYGAPVAAEDAAARAAPGSAAT